MAAALYLSMLLDTPARTVCTAAVSLHLADHLSVVGIDKWIDALGVVSAPVPRAGVQAALRFFHRHMPRLPPTEAFEFLYAMDLSKPVKTVRLEPGEKLIAFRTQAESPFKTFFTRPGRSQHALGINPEGREIVRFTVRIAVWALESYTSAAVDTWSRRGPEQSTTVVPRLNTIGVPARGGGVQLIVPASSSHLLVRSA